VAVHLLLWGITEAQHRTAHELKDNLYDLRKWLTRERVAHAVAHPFHRVDDRMTVWHVERLLLLFQHFEGVNGRRSGLTNQVGRHILTGIQPATIERLANLHNLVPDHESPWRKVLIGGSNDRSGMFAGQVFTETNSTTATVDFLAAIRAGECSVHGPDGSPLVMAHGLYNNLYRFAVQRFAGGLGNSLISKAFSRFMDGENPAEFSLNDKLGFLAEGIANGTIWEFAKPARASLWRHLSATMDDTNLRRVIDQKVAGVEEPQRRAFYTACFFADHLLYRFFRSFVEEITHGNVIEAVQDISMLVPITLGLGPYFYAFRWQKPERHWLSEVCMSVTGAVAPGLENTRRAWFTDTLADVNGVATTIKKMTMACKANGRDLVIVTSHSAPGIDGLPLVNFPPIGEFELPEYELQRLSFPPVLQMIDFIHRERFTELIISTPGPVGLTALLAGRLLGLRTSGIYHTDFPQYVRILTDDRELEGLAWHFMRWFYDAVDTLYVNSDHYRRIWLERGISPAKVRILPRGLDTELFHPEKRSPDFWVRCGAPPGSHLLLYVGRISREKDLDLLVHLAGRLGDRPACLAFVGDGPYMAELRNLLPEAIFTGTLRGAELAVAYASADLFVFPSTTDTFGNVVIEAQASGLPVIVSDRGGPKDLVQDGVTGIVTRALDGEDFCLGVLSLLDHPDRLAAMAAAARKSVESRSWPDAAEHFWNHMGQ
jgi:glycosyltransferase involved in cell wall biosynthesis